MQSTRDNRAAFTLVEVLVAMLLLSTAVLTLAASASTALRQVAESGRALRATTFAQNGAERAFATPCQAGASLDSANGVTLASTWTPSANATVSVNQTGQYHTHAGTKTESYAFLGGCY
jgi:Tfp pilus assembly protein PilV